jgi:hypothetical protein
VHIPLDRLCLPIFSASASPSFPFATPPCSPPLAVRHRLPFATACRSPACFFPVFALTKPLLFF